jgi:uroporphyrinogen-III decarboxylase
MAGSGAQSIAFDECMSLEMVGKVAAEYHVGFIGNLHTTSVLFEGRESGQDDANRCVREGAHTPGYVFGLGGPITQFVDPRRLEEAVAVIRSHGTSHG